MSKILVIPDVHGRPFWKQAVEKYGDEVDRIIFLGDEVDPYPDEGFTRKQAIRTLEEIIEFKLNNKDKTILLIGNHAAHYFIKNFPRSTRYDSSNAYKIKELYMQHRHIFQLAYEEIINNKKYLFTHAGLMNSWIERNKNIIGEPTVESLNHLLDNPRGIKALSDISRYRTWLGEKSGSILWSDVREKIDLDNSIEYNIIPNDDSIVDEYDYQIFGHTQLQEKPIITDKWACIDCRKAFILDENGTLTQVTDEKLE
jgi:hypothetical protein